MLRTCGQSVGAQLTAIGTPPRVTVEVAPDDALEQVRLRPRHHEVVRLANILEPRALQFLERAFELQVLRRLVVFIPQSRLCRLNKTRRQFNSLIAHVYEIKNKLTCEALLRFLLASSLAIFW